MTIVTILSFPTPSNDCDDCSGYNDHFTGVTIMADKINKVITVIALVFCLMLPRTILVLGIAALICSIGGFWPTVGLVGLMCFIVSK